MLTASDLEWVLDDLTAKLGISISDADRDTLRAAAPTEVEGIDAFARLALFAGGLEPSESRIHHQVSELVRASFRRAALRPENMDLFALDTLANDIEGFEDVMRLINHPSIGWTDYIGRKFNVTDVASSLLRLIREGKVEACSESESGSHIVGVGEGVVPAIPLEKLWYRMTPRGRMRHTAWAESNAPRE